MEEKNKTKQNKTGLSARILAQERKKRNKLSKRYRKTLCVCVCLSGLDKKTLFKSRRSGVLVLPFDYLCLSATTYGATGLGGTFLFLLFFLPLLLLLFVVVLLLLSSFGWKTADCSSSRLSQ